MAIDSIILAQFGEPPDNVDLSESHVVQNCIIVVAVLVIAVISVVLRLVSRWIQKTDLEMDDYLIVLGTIFVIPTLGLVVASGALGSGKHVWTVTAPHLIATFQLLYTYPWIYAATVTATKFSIIFFYFRIFGKTRNNLFLIPCYFACFLNAVYPIIMWTTMAACCRPLSTYWNSYIGKGNGTCIDVNQFFLALGIVNMLNDVLILLIPVPQILHLQMATKKKGAVVGILLLGGFVCIASCVRIYYLTQWSAAVDVTWAMGPVFIWSSIEPAIGIFSACLPTLGPLFAFAKERSSSRGKSYYSAGNNTPHDGHSNGWRRKSGMGNTSTFSGKFLRGDKNGTVTEEDEIKLTNVTVTGGNASEHHSANSEEGTLPLHGIVATTRIEHNVE